MAKPRLYKTIFQVHYAPKLRFFELLLPTAQRFTEYPHWKTNQAEIVLRDFEKHCSLAFQSKACTYDQDSSDAEFAGANIRRCLDVLPEAFELTTFERIGFRRQYLLNVPMDFASLVTVLNVKLLSQDEHLREALPTRVEDMFYRIDAADDEQCYHINVAPVRKSELQRALAFNQENHLDPETGAVKLEAIRKEYPEVAIFFDIDCYHDGPIPAAKTIAFVQKNEEWTSKFVLDMGKYLLATDVGE